MMLEIKGLRELVFNSGYYAVVAHSSVRSNMMG